MNLNEIKKLWLAGKLKEKPYVLARKHSTELLQLFPNIERAAAALWLYLNDFDESKIHCSVSNKNRRFLSFSKGAMKFCGNQTECICNRVNSQNHFKNRTPEQKKQILQKRKQTSFKRYGVEIASQSSAVKAKAEKTCIDKYGVKSPTQNATIFDKSKQTCRNNNGVDHPQQNQVIFEKTKNTFREKYGVLRPAQHSEFREKMKNTMLDRYGYENILQNYNTMKQIVKKVKRTKFQSFINHRQGFTPLFDQEFYSLSTNKTEFSWQCNTCDTQFKQVLIPGKVICPICTPKNETWGESYIRQILDSYNINYFQNNRSVIKPFELDFYLPDQNLAIEFNGIYWHCDKILNNKKYHQNKFKRCDEKSIKLIQIFEHELKHQQKLVDEKLKYHLKANSSNVIGARQCCVEKLSNAQSKEFFDQYHLQGNRLSNLVWGLKYNEEIVSVISFSKSRFKRKKNIDYELLRFATKSGISVPGAFSKLFKHAVKELAAESVITYANLNWGKGEMYSSAGFKFEKYTDPAYWYFKNLDDVTNRMHFQKHKLDNPENLSESQWAEKNGYNKFYDSGNAVWIWRKPN